MMFLDYIRGNRKGENARKVEYDAMSDPFLADAIDGFDTVVGNHDEQIAALQKRVSDLTVTHKRKSGAWKIAAAAILVIALVGGYFVHMNHESSMMSAHQADNGTFIYLYAPDEYVEKKRQELTEMQEHNMQMGETINPIVEISNLHDVIKPHEIFIVYLPNHTNLKDSELNELRDNLSESYYADNRNTRTESEADRRNVQAEARARADAYNRQMAEATGVITAEPVMPAASIVYEKKDNVLKGRVVDEYNEPMIGAYIAEKGTSNGTVTDIDGNFTLKTSNDNPKLVASMIGYETIEISKLKDSQLITMKEDSRTLSETVVTGMGAARKQSMTGSKSTSPSIGFGGLSSSVPSKSEPVGGMKNYKKYIEDNKRRPTSGECAQKKGTVKLQFFISEEDGSPKHIKVVKGVCKELDDEAIRLVREGAKWSYSPAKIKLDVKF